MLINQDGVLKHGKHVLPGARDTLALLANQEGRLAHPVPYLLMTNGGGMTEADRLVALEKDFGLPVSFHVPLIVSALSLPASRTLFRPNQGSSRLNQCPGCHVYFADEAAHAQPARPVAHASARLCGQVCRSTRSGLRRKGRLGSADRAVIRPKSGVPTAGHRRVAGKRMGPL